MFIDRRRMMVLHGPTEASGAPKRRAMLEKDEGELRGVDKEAKNSAAHLVGGEGRRRGESLRHVGCRRP